MSWGILHKVCGGGGGGGDSMLPILLTSISGPLRGPTAGDFLSSAPLRARPSKVTSETKRRRPARPDRLDRNTSCRAAWNSCSNQNASNTKTAGAHYRCGLRYILPPWAGSHIPPFFLTIVKEKESGDQIKPAFLLQHLSLVKHDTRDLQPVRLLHLYCD